MENKYTEMNEFLLDKLLSNQVVLKSYNTEKMDKIELLAILNAQLFAYDKVQDYSKGLFTPNYNEGKRLELERKCNICRDEINELEYKITEIENDNKKFIEMSEYMTIYINDHKQSKVKKSIYSEMGIRILKAQEDERQRIASDIHDTTVQNLTYLVHKTELCIKMLDIDQIRAKLELASMSNTIKSVINDMRDIIYDLKPMSLDDLGFIITLERHINQMMLAHDIHIRLSCDEQIEALLPLVKLSLFRVIQEACWNVIKHAKATQIDILFKVHQMDGTISIVIKDNGDGFNLLEYQSKSLERNTGFGLSIMKERIGLLSGKIDIQSSKGKGTIINISIPMITCKEEEKDE